VLWGGHRVHTEWQRPLPGVHSIMMEKLDLAGEGGVVHAHPHHHIYHHVQDCCVRSSWEDRYTVPLFLLYPFMYSVGGGELWGGGGYGKGLWWGGGCVSCLLYFYVWPKSPLHAFVKSWIIMMAYCTVYRAPALLEPALLETVQQIGTQLNLHFQSRINSTWYYWLDSDVH
jgi:hypothetical protein